MKNDESNLFIDSSVQVIHSAKKIIRNRKYSRVLCERQIKVTIPTGHFLTFHNLWATNCNITNLNSFKWVLIVPVANTIIKILNLKINHYLSRLTICKQPIRIKNDKIKAQRIQNKKDWFRDTTLLKFWVAMIFNLKTAAVVPLFATPKLAKKLLRKGVPPAFIEFSLFFKILINLKSSKKKPKRWRKNILKRRKLGIINDPNGNWN